MNQDQFLLDSGFWGWLYKLLYPVEWLMTQIMAGFHRFMVMLGMNEIGFSWVMSIVFLVIVVQACVFPLFYKSMKGMRKMQAQMAVLQPKMQRIQNKYKGKNDPASKEALQREMMKLYQDNDANPMGGCTSMLPMFVQGPVFMCMFYTLSAIPYIARGKFRNGSGLGAFDIATAKQFTSTNVFGVNVAENFTTADIHGKIIIGIFVALMCFCLWLMQYNSMKRNMAQSAANKQTEMMQKMMLWMFPIMYIFSGVAMPFAVLVYWLTNNICNQLTKWYENLARQLNIPVFFIDTCYNPWDHVTESRVRYVRAQIDQLIQDLCAFTGKSWDEERFQEVMKISQLNSYLWERANGLLDHKPAPIGGFELFNYMSAMVCNRGKPSTTAIMEQLNAEMEENILHGKSTFPVEEEFRVSWDGIACWPFLSHNLRTLKKFGINMVASSYGKAWAIEYDDLDGMARAYCFASTNSDNATTMIARRMEALKRFDCEGTIYHVNRSCKVMDCQMMEVQRQLESQAGVPFTSFDGDQADYRNYSEAQFETRIQGLVEVMKMNKEAKG